MYCQIYKGISELLHLNNITSIGVDKKSMTKKWLKSNINDANERSNIVLAI